MLLKLSPADREVTPTIEPDYDEGLGIFGGYAQVYCLSRNDISREAGELDLKEVPSFIVPASFVQRAKVKGMGYTHYPAGIKVNGVLAYGLFVVPYIRDIPVSTGKDIMDDIVKETEIDTLFDFYYTKVIRAIHGRAAHNAVTLVDEIGELTDIQIFEDTINLEFEFRPITTPDMVASIFTEVMKISDEFLTIKPTSTYSHVDDLIKFKFDVVFNFAKYVK